MDLVESFQPYRRGRACDTDPLWVLHDLNRIDKHRKLVVSLLGPWTIEINPPFDVPAPQAEFNLGPYKLNDPIATYSFPIPQPDLDLDPNVELFVFLDEVKPALENMRYRMGLLYSWVRWTIVPRFEAVF